MEMDMETLRDLIDAIIKAADDNDEAVDLINRLLDVLKPEK